MAFNKTSFFGHFMDSLSSSHKFINYLGFHIHIIPSSSIYPNMQGMVRPPLGKIAYEANNLQTLKHSHIFRF